MKNSVKNAISFTRQAGNTQGIVDAAIKTKGLIVVSTYEVGRYISKRFSFPSERIIAINNLEEYFVGRVGNRPLFFDNSAIIKLVSKEVE